MIRIGSLFSGIGGFELGLERAIPQAQTIWQVEQDKFCQSILHKHWPQAKIYNDVRTITKDNVEPIDILCGGFPCQDISIAGKGKGIKKNETRSGLFWEMHRLIHELEPSVAVLENVPAITFRGGLQVLGALAEIGYDAEWIVISAREFGAPHKRERWFCVAYPVGKSDKQFKKTRKGDKSCKAKQTSLFGDNAQAVRDFRCDDISSQPTYTNSERLEKKDAKCMRFESKRKRIQSLPISTTNGESEKNATNPHSERLQQTTIQRTIQIDDNGRTLQQRTPQKQTTTTYTTNTGYWRTSHPEPLICRVDDGVSRRLDNPRLKSLGNAIVPQCSQWIGEQILKSGLLDNIL